MLSLNIATMQSPLNACRSAAREADKNTENALCTQNHALLDYMSKLTLADQISGSSSSGLWAHAEGQSTIVDALDDELEHVNLDTISPAIPHSSLPQLFSPPPKPSQKV